jgi:hypothetical protein
MFFLAPTPPHNRPPDGICYMANDRLLAADIQYMKDIETSSLVAFF